MAPLEALPEVEANHKWSVSDVTGLRDRLIEICADNTFDAPTTRWIYSILGELGDAIDAGWCGCGGLWTGPYSVDYSSTTISDGYHSNSTSTSESWDCNDDGIRENATRVVDFTLWSTFPRWSGGNLQVGPAGITGRFATLRINGNAHKIYTNNPHAPGYDPEVYESDWAIHSNVNLGSVDTSGWIHLYGYDLPLAFSQNGTFDGINYFTYNNAIHSDITNGCPPIYSSDDSTYVTYAVSSDLWIDRA